MGESTENGDNIIHVDFGGPKSAESSGELAVVEADPASLEKLDIFSELVELGTVMVTLDTRVDGVEVPPGYRGQARLNLNFCHDFRIPDFAYDEAGVRASLSFSGIDYFCDIPWPSVYMMRSHVENDVVLFPSDVPPEMLFLAPPGDPREEE